MFRCWPLPTRLAHHERAAAAHPHGEDALSRLDVVRISDRLLRQAGSLLPAELRSLAAIHLATAIALGTDLVRVCTYDERMASAATDMGMTVVAPS